MGMFRREFPSDLNKMHDALTEVMSYIHDTARGLDGQDEADLRLVISELLANAVIHGNECDPQKKVAFEADVSYSDVRITIRDEGTGFDHVNETGCPHKSRVFDEHGRGLDIVCSLSDEVTFNGPGNEVRVKKRLRTNG